VLFVAPSAYLLGGLAVWLDYLLPGLREGGWDAILGLVEGPRHHRPEQYLQIHPDVQSLRIACQTGTAIGRRHALRKAYHDYQPDLVISVNIPDSIIAAAQMPSRVRPRTLFACHGIQSDLFADMAFLAESLDGVACTNRLACRLSGQLGTVPPERVYYAPCGTLPAAVYQIQNQEIFTVAYVGRLEQDQKRVLDLVPILTRLVAQGVNAQLLIAGNGPDETLLREHFAAAGLLDRVRFLGHVSSAAIPTEVYHYADALLITSLWETGPIVIWEAMAHQVPIVSSAYVGSGIESALIHRKNALLFPIGDCVTASQMLLELRSSPELGDGLRSQSMKTFQDRYTLEKSVRSWDSAMRAVLQGTPRGAKTFDGPRQNSRLDRVLPPDAAETLRRWTGRKSSDSGAGGEWPHSVTGGQTNEDVFWEIAKRLDSSQEPSPLGDSNGDGCSPGFQ